MALFSQDISRKVIMINRENLDNEKITALVMLGVILVIICALTISVWPSSSSNKNEAAIKTVTTTSKPEVKKETTTTSTSSSTTSTSSSTTTTTKKSETAAAQAASTATVTTPFAATSTASKTNEGYHCGNPTFTFSGSASANKAGTAQYVWIRSDGVSTGASGSLTFNSDGVTSDSISSYTLEIPGAEDNSGWVALKLTFDGGSYTSSHASYAYTYVPDGQSISPSIC